MELINRLFYSLYDYEMISELTRLSKIISKLEIKQEPSISKLIKIK